MRRRDRFYAWLRAKPLVPDAVLACALFLLLVVPAAGALDPGWPHLALGATMYAALVVRRVLPVVSFAGVAVAGLVKWATEVDLTQADIGVLIAVYSVSAYGPRWASRLGLAVGLLGAVLASQRFGLVQGAGAFMTGVGMYGAAIVGVWALGDVRRVRQAYVAELVERTRQAERERDQQAQIAAAAERARIAREMHDVVAHNLSVIVAQADGGRYSAVNDPHRAVGVLDTIASTGRSALAEMRRLIGVLRSGEDSPSKAGTTGVADMGDGTEAREPQPGLADVADLVASYRDAGLTVDVEVTGTERPVAAGPALAMYRVVQEALTNVLKHAGPGARASVRLAYGDDRIDVRVADDGEASSSRTPGAGHGLAGMRERLELYGAEMQAGPRPDGGWRVDVEMPTGSA